MNTLTKKESEALLLLFKDFRTNYNANSLSKKIDITPRGALKIMKNLNSQGILIEKKFGKAVFYKVNLKDNYTRKLVETLLISESREKAERWIDEFKDIFNQLDIAIIFGSAIRNYKAADDIDIILVIDKKRYKSIKEFISIKNKILPKQIHPIIMTLEDLRKNLEKNNPAMINAIKEGYALKGYEKITDVIKDVTSF